MGRIFHHWRVVMLMVTYYSHRNHCFCKQKTQATLDDARMTKIFSFGSVVPKLEQFRCKTSQLLGNE